MMHGLNFDETDSNYMLLNEIFKIIGSRESKQIMSRNGLKPLNKVISLVKTVILAAYFECSISFVVDELKSKSELRKGLNFDIVLEAQEIYDRLSKVNPEQLENTVNSILNKLRNDYSRGRRTFIIDATPRRFEYLILKVKKFLKNHWRIKIMLGLGEHQSAFI